MCCWYEYGSGRVTLSMEARARRVGHLRANPHVSLSVLADDWYNCLSLLGRVVEITDDPDFSVIDRLSMRYRGERYPERSLPLVTAVVEVTRWHTYGTPGAEAGT